MLFIYHSVSTSGYNDTPLNRFYYSTHYTDDYMKAKGIIAGDFNKGDSIQLSVENDSLIFNVSE